ncbi:MAG: potassium channel family protein [Chloroflexota bacterium]
MRAIRELLYHPGGVQGRVKWVVLIVVAVQFLYPLGQSDAIWRRLVFQSFYGLLFVAGILVSRGRPRIIVGLVAVAAVWGVVDVISLFYTAQLWSLLLAYASVICLQGAVFYVLIDYIATARRITADVLYAAIAAYLLLGGMFVPIFGTIETLTWVGSGYTLNAFTDPGIPTGDQMPWQSLIYYSYATLTTLGYGDMLPVTSWARSAATFEAVLGVLYTTIILARLVGLYTADDVEEEMKTVDGDLAAHESVRT